MRKQIKTITIDSDLLKWIENMIKKKEFGSLSHAVEKALYLMKESYETKERYERKTS